jgi:hypothetical protein
MFSAPEKRGAATLLVADASGDSAMEQRQVERELSAVLAALPGSPGTVTVVWPGIDQSHAPFVHLVGALVDRGVSQVMLDAGGEPVQVHPPLVLDLPTLEAIDDEDEEPAAEPARAPRVSAPAEVAASFAVEVGESPIALLGRKDDVQPPLVILGVEAGSDTEHVSRVTATMQHNLPRLRGRCVLLVLQKNGRDVPVRREDILVRALRRTVATAASATLLFRGPDHKQRPHFQVAHSIVRGLPFGATFADPRGAR